MATACFIFMLTNNYTEGSTTDPVASPLLTDFKPFRRIVSKDECKLPIVQLTACMYMCVVHDAREYTKCSSITYPFRSKIHLYSKHIVLYYGKLGATVVEK